MVNDIANAHVSIEAMKHGTTVVFQNASGIANFRNTISTGSHAREISALPASGTLFPKYDARFDDNTYYTA
tara:strand:+ start:253 stop:465 length:213 start_codon:yes stop_codon:yes gene_type:complete